MIKRKIFLLGSTGSIGVNTLKCIEFLNQREKLSNDLSKKFHFEVVGLAAGNNYRLLSKQIIKHQPEVVYIDSKMGHQYLKKQFLKLKIYSSWQNEKRPEVTDIKSNNEINNEAIDEALMTVKYDICVNAFVGSFGCYPTLTAMKCGADIALANKETLIMAGDIVKQYQKKYKVQLLPIDSEHSAIFSLLKGIKKKEIEQLIITASGGPFFFKSNVKPDVQSALNHPTWKMGKKITIDSATMMNKGFEIIEAHYLFDIPIKKIKSIIHPQSLVHSMIETIDGEIYAQLGVNDMKHPIQTAITWPYMVKNKMKKLKLWEIENLSFFKNDLKRYPLLKIAYDSAQRGGSALAALNAANEAAVYLFLQGKIDFFAIAKIVKKTVDNHPFRKKPNLNYILNLDKEIKKMLINQS